MDSKPAFDFAPFLLVGAGIVLGLLLVAASPILVRLRHAAFQRQPRWPKARWIVIPVFVCALLAIALLWLFYTPLYRATAVVRISPTSMTIVFPNAKQETPQYQVFVNTEVLVIAGHTIMERVLDNQSIRETQWYNDTSRQTMAFGISGIYEKFEEALSVEPRQGTELIDISFSATRPGDAQKIAEAVVTEYRKLRGDLDKHNQLKAILTTDQTTLQMEIDGLIKTRFTSSSRLGTDAPEQLRSLLSQRMNKLEDDIHDKRLQQQMMEWSLKYLEKATSQPTTLPGEVIGTQTLAQLGMDRERLVREIALLDRELVGQRRSVAEAGEVAQDTAIINERIRQKRDLYELVRQRREQIEMEEKAPARVRQVASAAEPIHPWNDPRPGATLIILIAAACLSLLLLALRPERNAKSM